MTRTEIFIPELQEKPCGERDWSVLEKSGFWDSNFLLVTGCFNHEANKICARATSVVSQIIFALTQTLANTKAEAGYTGASERSVDLMKRLGIHRVLYRVIIQSFLCGVMNDLRRLMGGNS